MSCWSGWPCPSSPPWDCNTQGKTVFPKQLRADQGYPERENIILSQDDDEKQTNGNSATIKSTRIITRSLVVLSVFLCLPIIGLFSSSVQLSCWELLFSLAELSSTWEKWRWWTFSRTPSLYPWPGKGHGSDWRWKWSGQHRGAASGRSCRTTCSSWTSGHFHQRLETVKQNLYFRDWTYSYLYWIKSHAGPILSHVLLSLYLWREIAWDSQQQGDHWKCILSGKWILYYAGKQKWE